jgi:hypothetical protein
MQPPNHFKTLLLVGAAKTASSWQQWNFSSFASDDWRELWTLSNGPGARRGHTMVVFNETNVVLFGGRGNDAHRHHVPSRYNVVEDRGLLEFSTHDSYPLSSSYDPESEFCQPVQTCVPLTDASSGNEEMCSYSWDHLLENDPSPNEQSQIEEMCGFVPVGQYFNDVWVYDTNCLRYADMECANDGWRIWHEGMTFGGCNNEGEDEIVCQTPSERYGHGAAVVDESTMAVYGGYSHECEDFCDDMWFFDFNTRKWMKQQVGSGSNGPGRRWKFSMVATGGAENSHIYLFGGHRLWHGFSVDNSADNRWESRELLPEGGYLNDFWVFRQTDQGERQWKEVEKKQTCHDAPGLTWESRNDKHCEIHWPKVRSGHASVFDSKRNGIWIHGGYRTYYPYPTSKDSGSGFGVNSLGREHTAIYPTFEFYLDDLWFYDIASGFWEKKRLCKDHQLDTQCIRSFIPFDQPVHSPNHTKFQLEESHRNEPATSLQSQAISSFYTVVSLTTLNTKILGITSLKRIAGLRNWILSMPTFLKLAQMIWKKFKVIKTALSLNSQKT